jgi:hypothetical protein
MAASERGVLAVSRRPDLLNPKIYKDLYKYQALALIQARPDCKGMAEFLFQSRVSDVPSPLCSCGQAPEISEHVLFYCREIKKEKKEVRSVIAFATLRTRKDLAKLFLKYPGLAAEWLL